ncbi:MAG TPA: RidA family protein [Phycisphaerales bacterium]|nr:RidA family protein [Phycisphaerales bacterium]
MSAPTPAPSDPPRPDTITSRGAPEPLGAYPHARRAGGLLFLSGIGPRTRGSAAIPGVRLAADGGVASYDFEVQARACFENVRTVLEQSGSSLDRAVDVLGMLTDLRRDFAVYNRLYAEYFGGSGACRTTIEVARLPQGGSAPIAIELKVIALAGPGPEVP